MKCVSMQIALFWKEKLERPDLFANRINQRMNNIFDAMPQIINVPPDLPVDVPLVQIGSTTSGIQLNVSRGRCDMQINANILAQNSLGGVIISFQDLILKYISSVFEEKDLKLVRMGIIAVAFENNENAVDEVVTKYLNPNVTKVKEISIRINKEGSITNFKLNNILDISVGNLINEGLGVNENGIVYQRDINNVESDIEFSLKHAKELWKYAVAYFTDKKMGEIK